MLLITASVPNFSPHYQQLLPWGLAQCWASNARGRVIIVQHSGDKRAAQVITQRIFCQFAGAAVGIKFLAEGITAEYSPLPTLGLCEYYQLLPLNEGSRCFFRPVL